MSSSHLIYKLKVLDDHSLKLKARIASHGNEDSLKNELSSDCSMCCPVGMRLLLSTAALRKWLLIKMDVKPAFLQTRPAQRDVYVVPPRESKDRGKRLWLLLAAAYGLESSNAKLQVQFDKVLDDLGLKMATFSPQLFLLMRDTGSSE